MRTANYRRRMAQSKFHRCNMKLARIIFASALVLFAGGFVIGGLLAATPALNAQETQSRPPAGDTAATTIKAETRLVLVDTIVADKKGGYVSDLTLKDFKVWEDNKEQVIKTFSFEKDTGAPSENSRRYLVLFFDNSSMDLADQGRARLAA